MNCIKFTSVQTFRLFGHLIHYISKILDEILFVCDGTSGLKIYDASNPMTLGSNLIKQYTGITPYDVIPLGNILVLIGTEGLYQYDYSDINNIQLLSSIVIPVNE